MGMLCHDAFLLSAPFRYPDGEEQYMTTMKAKKEQHPKMLPCWQSHGVHSLEPVFAYFNSMKGFAILIPTWLHRRLELIFAIQPNIGGDESYEHGREDTYCSRKNRKHI